MNELIIMIALVGFAITLAIVRNGFIMKDIDQKLQFIMDDLQKIRNQSDRSRNK